MVLADQRERQRQRQRQRLAERQRQRHREAFCRHAVGPHRAAWAAWLSPWLGTMRPNGPAPNGPADVRAAGRVVLATADRNGSGLRCCARGRCGPGAGPSLAFLARPSLWRCHDHVTEHRAAPGLRSGPPQRGPCALLRASAALAPLPCAKRDSDTACPAAASTPSLALAKLPAALRSCGRNRTAHSLSSCLNAVPGPRSCARTFV